MDDLNPLTGHLYVEALHMTRVAREACVLICGKYPHPQTIVPGGMSSTIDLTVMNEMFVRLAQFFDYSKKISRIWDEITEFFTRPIPTIARSGRAARTTSTRASSITTTPTTPPTRTPPAGRSPWATRARSSTASS